MKLNESIVENATLEWFSDLGYALGTGPDIAPGEPASERSSFADVILVRRLQDAIRRLNPQIPPEAQDEALRKVVRLDGSIAGDRVRLVDFGRPAANDWFAVNQFTVIESQHNRRPDVVVFVNGLTEGAWHLHAETVFQICFTTQGIPDSLTVAARL